MVSARRSEKTQGLTTLDVLSEARFSSANPDISTRIISGEDRVMTHEMSSGELPESTPGARMRKPECRAPIPTLWAPTVRGHSALACPDAQMYILARRADEEEAESARPSEQ